jgi:hypothetical protein
MRTLATPLATFASIALIASVATIAPATAVSTTAADDSGRADSTTAGLATFTYTGGPQDWSIPRGVTSAYVTLIGGAGGVGNAEMAFAPKPPAPAAQVRGTLTWPAGTFALFPWVGGVGGDASGVDPQRPSPGTPGAGGWNGGATGGTGSVGSSSGGGGGGATDIRIGGFLPSTRVMVAGGGGGQGGIDFGESDPEGQGLGGQGGIGTAIAGVWAGADGTTALGDNGGRGGTGGFNPGGQATPGGNAETATNNGGGGGGGGGWFGGAGGGAGRSGVIGISGPGGGGGGGSSYADPTTVTNATATAASITAAPTAQIAWVDLQSTTLPSLTVGATTSQQLVAAFPVPGTSLSWTVTRGRLPSGMNLSSAGVLSGMPTQAGSYDIDVTVTAQPGNLATSSTTLRGTVERGGPTPSAPTDISAVGGTSAATVQWSTPSYTGTTALTNYQVRWSSNAGQTWSNPQSVPATATTYTASLTGGQSYVFQVAAVNAAGSGPWSTSSNSVNVISSPSAPTNVTGVTGYESVTLSWQAPSNQGGAPTTGYTIRYSTDGGGAWTQLPNTGTTATQATVSGLTSQAGYIFEVAAINAAGVSAWSSPSSIIYPEIDPATPSDVVGISGYQSVELSWLAPPSSVVPVTGYLVRYSADSGASWSAPVPTGSTALTYDYTGLTQPDFLIFQVAATNANGSSTWSAPSAPVSPETRPSPPTKVRALAEDRAVTLTWNPPADLAGGTLSGYRIDMRTSSSEPWRIHTATTGTTATRYRIDNLANGTTYEFRVAAITELGVGVPSQSATATPFGLPGRPIDVRAVAGNARATVTWQAPASTNGRAVVGYRIEAATSTGWYLVVENTASTATSHTVTGLTNGESYLFRVAAINRAGAGGESVPSPAVTPSAQAPTPPRHVSTRSGVGIAQVSWQPPRSSGTFAVTSYVVETSAAGGPWSVQCQTSTNTCRLPGLSTTTPYRFRVAAVSAAGMSPWTEPTRAITPGTTPTRPAVAKVTVRGHEVRITAESTWLGSDQLQWWNPAGFWAVMSNDRLTLPRDVEQTRIRAVHRGNVSPELSVTVARPSAKTMQTTVVIDGDRSRITAPRGNDLRWRYNSTDSWKRVTTPLSLQTPQPPRPWTLLVRDFTRSVTVDIQIR